MQSGQKIELRSGRKPKNPRNSFVPEENSVNNEFLENGSRISNQSSNLSPARLKREEQQPRVKRLSREDQEQSSKTGRNNKSRIKKHSKMDVIHEENLNIVQKNQPKPKIKKVHSQIFEQKVQSSRVIPHNKNHNNQTQVIKEETLSRKNVEEIPEEKKMQDLNAGMQKLSESILDLRSKYLQLEKEQQQHLKVIIHHKKKETTPNNSKQKKKGFNFGEKSVQQMEKQYKEFIKSQRKKKEARKKVLEQIAEKDRLKIQQQQQQKWQQKENQKWQRLYQIKQRNKFTQKHKSDKERQQQRKKIIEQFVKKYEGMQYLVHKRQKEDNEKRKEMFEQQRQYLLERKQIFKPINFQQIDEHQKWYLDKIQQLTNQKRQMKNEELKKIEEENSQLPQFWKGRAHNIALEERLEKVRKKKQPKQKVKRINQYKVYVRQNFVPRTHPNQLQNSQIKNDSGLTHREIKRFRYYKGMSYGQVIQTRPVAKSSQQIRRMGIHNFQYMKKLPKKRQSSVNLEAQEIKLLNQSPYRKKQDHYLPEQSKQSKNTKIALPEAVKIDELTMIMRRIKASDQRLKHKQYALNSQPQVLNEYINQRSINDEIIDNIQRKLSLLSQL